MSKAKIIKGLASLFKKKGASKNKLVSDNQMFEAEVMQNMMKDPKYNDFAKSRLG